MVIRGEGMIFTLGSVSYYSSKGSPPREGSQRHGVCVVGNHRTGIGGGGEREEVLEGTMTLYYSFDFFNFFFFNMDMSYCWAGMGLRDG